MSRASRPFSIVFLTAIAAVTVCSVGVASALFIDPSLAGMLVTQTDDPMTSRPTAVPTQQTATPAPIHQTAATETTSGRESQYTIRDGPNASTVYVRDSGRPGPTVAVVGGQHGNEPAGAVAAGETTSWQLDRGVLVVIPRANPRGLQNRSRKVDGRDLNAQFPVGERPTSPQARALWRVLVRHEIDVLVDLHSSEGIYGVDGGVGQAVFPTVTGDAVSNADVAIDRVNREFVLDGNRSFRRGNAMGRSGKSLTRKVAGDLNETAYIVETTKRGTNRETRVEWTTAVTWELLRLHGVVSGTRPQKHESDGTTE